MENITRRTMIQTLGVTLAAPLVRELYPLQSASEPAPPQNSAPTKLRFKVAPLRPHFIRFVHDQALTTFVRLRNGAATSDDLTLLATSIYTLAQHYRDTGIDSAVRAAAPRVNPSNVGALAPPDLARYTAYAKTFDASISESTLWTPHHWPAEDVSLGLETLASEGISKALDNAADRIHAYAQAVKMPSASFNTPPRAHLAAAVYKSNLPSRARIVPTAAQACSCNPWIDPCPKPQWCEGLGIAWTLLSSAVGAVIQQCADNPATWAFCGALGAEIAALGLSVSSIAGWSIFVIGLILLIICT